MYWEWIGGGSGGGHNRDGCIPSERLKVLPQRQLFARQLQALQVSGSQTRERQPLPPRAARYFLLGDVRLTTLVCNRATTGAGWVSLGASCGETQCSSHKTMSCTHTVLSTASCRVLSPFCRRHVIASRLGFYQKPCCLLLFIFVYYCFTPPTCTGEAL